MFVDANELRDAEELFELTCSHVVRQTPRAILVRTTLRTEHWLPISLIRDTTDSSVLVPLWFAEKAGIEREITQRMAARRRLTLNCPSAWRTSSYARSA